MKKPYSAEQAYSKIASACVAKELCSYDIARKLKQWGVDNTQQLEVIERLKSEKFQDDARYVRAYVHDKVMFERWGRQKIRQSLAMKNLTGSVVNEALENIDQELYMDNLKNLLQQKRRSLTDDDEYQQAVKMMRYAAGRGYTFDEIKQCVDTDFDM